MTKQNFGKIKLKIWKANVLFTIKSKYRKSKGLKKNFGEKEGSHNSSD